MFATDVTNYKKAYFRLLELHQLMLSGVPVGNVHRLCLASVERHEALLGTDVTRRIRASIDKAFGIAEEAA